MHKYAIPKILVCHHVIIWMSYLCLVRSDISSLRATKSCRWPQVDGCTARDQSNLLLQFIVHSWIHIHCHISQGNKLSWQSPQIWFSRSESITLLYTQRPHTWMTFSVCVLGGRYGISHQIRRASNVYGAFQRALRGTVWWNNLGS